MVIRSRITHHISWLIMWSCCSSALFTLGAMTLDSSYQDVSDLWYTLSLMLISAFTLTLPSIAIYGLAYVTSGSAQGDPRSSSSKIHYESLINLTPLVLIFYIMQRYLLEGYSVQILSYVWLIEVVLV